MIVVLYNDVVIVVLVFKLWVVWDVFLVFVFKKVVCWFDVQFFGIGGDLLVDGVVCLLSILLCYFYVVLWCVGLFEVQVQFDGQVVDFVL